MSRRGERKGRSTVPASGGGMVLREVGAGNGSGWGARYTSALERIVEVERMHRGRRTARDAKVLDIRILNGQVAGDVRGSQPSPFASAVRFRPLAAEDRADLIARVRGEPGVLGALASGTVPGGLAEVLLPADSGDVGFACTCPESGLPCRHAVAVALLAAQDLDRDPAGMLALRGLSLDEVIDAVAASAWEIGPSAADPFSARGPRPAVPRPPADTASVPAMLNPARLREALGLWGGDPAAAESELDMLYRRMRRRR